MKKTITTTIAALLISTSVVGPAAANDDLIRLGIGLGATLLGEAMKGGGNSQARPRNGDKLEGRVDGKPIRQGSNQTAKTKKQREEAEKAEWAARFPVPNVGPVPEAKPTPEQMTAWLAAAPEREAQDAAAEAEMAAGPVVATDATTTAAVETTQASQLEEATVELFDNTNQSWGKVTPTQAAKADEFARLGMSRADSYRAIGRRGPMAAYPEWDGKRELRDENGRVWGRVDVDVMERVAKAVEMGMPASKAIPAIANLVDPDVIAAKAKAEAEASDATKAECLERAKNGDLLHAGIRHLKCGEFQAEIAEIEAQVKAEETADQMADGDEQLAACIDKRINPRTKDERFKECEPFEAEVAHAIEEEERWKGMTPTQAFNASKDMARADKEKQWRETAKDKREAAVLAAKEREELDAVLGTAPSTENQTTAAPIDKGDKPAIDEANKTGAIEADPKPAEQQPAKIKPKKLDL
ncbi:hypothetical protein [Ensifer sp. B1-9]|uniref:hypothetical protein n=1 Tax=Ensifer sp. B1-9 TaxID=3141455 RepID=UPI003D234A57